MKTFQFQAFVMVATLASGACGRSAPAPAQEPGLEGLSVTQWTDRTELFAEYPPLVVGETSRFAIHLTRLDTFKALTAGHVEVRLTGGGAAEEVFEVDGPSRPGIFGVNVKPAHAGARELAIVLRGSVLQDQHRIGAVTVHTTTAEARAAAGADEGGDEGISFLKEQQWTLDFATAIVGQQALRETIRVPAQVVARPGGAADVVAPIDGRLTHVVELPLGAAVSRGQPLARLVPPPSVPSDLPQIRHARTEARAELDLAARDRGRAERLVAAGAAPQKRLDEARAAEAQARARVEASDARLAQYDAARTAGDASTDGLFFVRAPVSGVIAQRDAVAGANVSSGALLFRIIDPRHVNVIGQVPEADAIRARSATGAELEIPGQSSRMPVGALASIGRVLDPQTRTVPIIFTLDNATLGLPVGQAVALHLLMNEVPARPVVLASAVVDDAGRPVIYVQREGETFERRPVTLGPRTGDRVQVIDGVKPGERVVTTGAYLVRLASLSTQAPAHGHVH